MPDLQGDALRPFAAILRHSDSHTVRELAVACVVHAITAHPRGLGSGWRSVIEALTVAAGDSSPGGTGFSRGNYSGIVCVGGGRLCIF